MYRALEQLQARVPALEGIEAEIGDHRKARARLEDALKVKEKMLDDQNETIATLKVLGLPRFIDVLVLLSG